MNPLISIVIPTRNRRALLLQTLGHLSRQTKADPNSWEVIVVADGCTDGTERAVQTLAQTAEWSGRMLRCIEQKPGGASAARNNGLRSARGKLVLFLDDDIWAGHGLIPAHLARHANGVSSVVVGRIVPEGGRGALHRQLRRWSHGHHQRLIEHGPTFLALYSGNVSVPRDAAIEAGGFDEEIDYGEDVEFGYRLQRIGLTFVYAPEATGTDRSPKQGGALLKNFHGWGRGSVRIYRKWREALPALPLVAFGETSLRMRVVRGALLAAAENRMAEHAIDRLFRWWAGSKGYERIDRQAFELARSYYFWRGVRAEVADSREWSRLTSSGVPILLYHSVEPASPSNPSRYIVTTRQFALQMALLKLLGYRVQTLDKLIDTWASGRLPPPRSIAITFDDGYRDNMTQAWPVMRRLGYSATLFFVTGLAGQSSLWDVGVGFGPRALLTWEELVRLDDEGFRAEPHSVSHPDLTKLDPKMVDFELGESRRQLEERIGRPTLIFAYPYGQMNPAVRDQVRGAGYRAALSVNHGLNTLRTDHFALKRVSVWGEDNLLDFGLKVWAGDNPLDYLPSMRSLRRS